MVKTRCSYVHPDNGHHCKNKYNGIEPFCHSHRIEEHGRTIKMDHDLSVEQLRNMFENRAQASQPSDTSQPSASESDAMSRLTQELEVLTITNRQLEDTIRINKLRKPRPLEEIGKSNYYKLMKSDPALIMFVKNEFATKASALGLPRTGIPWQFKKSCTDAKFMMLSAAEKAMFY